MRAGGLGDSPPAASLGPAPRSPSAPRSPAGGPELRPGQRRAQCCVPGRAGREGPCLRLRAVTLGDPPPNPDCRGAGGTFPYPGTAKGVLGKEEPSPPVLGPGPAVLSPLPAAPPNPGRGAVRPWGPERGRSRGGRGCADRPAAPRLPPPLLSLPLEPPSPDGATGGTSRLQHPGWGGGRWGSQAGPGGAEGRLVRRGRGPSALAGPRPAARPRASPAGTRRPSHCRGSDRERSREGRTHSRFPGAGSGHSVKFQPQWAHSQPLAHGMPMAAREPCPRSPVASAAETARLQMQRLGSAWQCLEKLCQLLK